MATWGGFGRDDADDDDDPWSPELRTPKSQ